MNRHWPMVCSTATILTASWLGFVGAAAAAPAVTPDEQFTAAVTALGITMAPDADIPGAGHQICQMLSSGIDGNPNPVPVVRGVVTTLQNKGITRSQAGGLTKAAVFIYCPQYANFVGR